MSSLPNPKDFNNFKIELSNRIEFDEMQQDYDLNNIYNSFKKNPILQDTFQKYLILIF